jgi:hypothetical protein
MFLNTIEPYKPPKDSQVHLLGSNLLPLSFEEMMELSNLYQDENWSKIAYSVTNSLLQPYVDDILSEIIKRKVDRDIHNSNKINSLYFKTQVCNPFCCDWTREIKYFTGNGEYFLGGIKVFAIQLKSVVDLTSILRLISGLAQVNILSNLPCNRMLIALVHPEYWELVFAEVAVNSTTKQV